jgi:hypothetical protein
MSITPTRCANCRKPIPATAGYCCSPACRDAYRAKAKARWRRRTGKACKDKPATAWTEFDQVQAQRVAEMERRYAAMGMTRAA